MITLIAPTTDSDNMRGPRRIGPIAQEMFTMAFAIAACVVVLVLIALAPAATGPASAPQQLAAAPTSVLDGVFVPPAISSADTQPETLPSTF